mgnify:FL=1
MKLETQTEQIISETVTVYGLSPQIGIHALAQTVNALAAQGAVFSVCPETTTETSAGVLFRLPVRNTYSDPGFTRLKSF